ncbi:MAG TPA: NADH-quinone oxidoreductase subunit C [Tepidisphaeraceae bacterium]|jgi:Ni,Fe-hydrogenase III large subunit|nr:NADH-quinone oxidoreductase subunit C [Tepidisphaeraceae bacterium]
MTGVERLASIVNGRAIDRRAIPELSNGEFQEAILDAVAEGLRVASLFGVGNAQDETVRLYLVLADDQESRLRLGTTTVADRFESLTPRCLQVHLFEREIAEQFGVKPEGHPWLKPVRFQQPYRKAHDSSAESAGQQPLIGVTDFYRVEGDEVHEVAVGPVHAGVIEPGHFRFQCHGEEVFHLEISLGYQHRGVERAMMGGPNKRSVHYAETLAGDTTVGHCTAYCQVIEALAKCQKTARAQTLRGIALELERLANHVGDLGALANDVGYLPTASYCGRLRGDFLNMTALLCGSRFGRGMIRPGGVGFDVDQKLVDELLSRMAPVKKDCKSAIELLWDSPSVMARFEETGRVSNALANELGLVGPAARACDLSRDARHDQPSGIFRFAHIPVASWNSGDVFARAYVRWLEVQRSMAFIEEQLEALPMGSIRREVKALSPNQLAISLIEGWRGELCHVALTDAAGRFERYKVVDPSFHNWIGLAIALRGQQISDFPLCNKSFNLSYCGHDL